MFNLDEEYFKKLFSSDNFLHIQIEITVWSCRDANIMRLYRKNYAPLVSGMRGK